MSKYASSMTHLPVPVRNLTRRQPSFAAMYPSIAAVLATERRAGRLRISPITLWLGGETLSDMDRDAIAAAFQCSVLGQYGASECMSIACECACGAMHLNADWVLLEPVGPVDPDQPGPRAIVGR